MDLPLTSCLEDMLAPLSVLLSTGRAGEKRMVGKRRKKESNRLKRCHLYKRGRIREHHPFTPSVHCLRGEEHIICVRDPIWSAGTAIRNSCKVVVLMLKVTYFHHQIFHSLPAEKPCFPFSPAFWDVSNSIR